MKFKHRLLIWTLIALFIPILIFIYDGAYNATAMGWIVGVAVLTEKDKARVYATKSGKLYIKPFDLFGLKKVQNLITKIANALRI